MRNQRLTKSLNKLSKSKQENITLISGTLGLPLNGQKLVEVPNRNGFVYVKLRDNQSEVIQAYNAVVSNIYGLAVLVARQGSIYKVIGRDQDRYRDWGNIPYLPRHGGQHSFNQALGMGADVTWVYSQQMMPLLGYPSGSNGSNGIVISPYIVRSVDGAWKYVGNTGTPDISMYRPTIATGAVMVLVYIDTVSGNPYLLVGSGSTFHSGLTGTADIVPYIPRPTNPNWIPDTAVRLTTGTTTLTWTNLYDVRPFLQVVPTGSSSGGGGATGSFDSVYLKLDTSNDPLTGKLDIIPSTADTSGLNIEMLGDAPAFVVTQRATGTTSISAPTFGLIREPLGDGAVSFPEAIFEMTDTEAPSGTIVGSMLRYIKNGTTRVEINPNAQGTGTLALLDTAFTLSPGGLLLLLKNNGTSRFYVNASGTAYSNGVPLIKEAPINGLPYVRRNAGWEIASTGTASVTNPPITGSFVLQENGQTLGSALVLNVINPNISTTISGTVARIFVTGSASAIVEDLTPQVSGSQTRFILSRPVSSNGVMLIYNGVTQRVTDHFTVSGTIINTLFTPATGTTLQAVELGVYPTVSSSGYQEGIAFPSIPSVNDKFYRTDRNILYYYDGTRWLSVQIFEHHLADFANASANAGNYTAVWEAIYDVYVVDYIATMYAASGLSATAYWRFDLYFWDGGTQGAAVASVNNQSGTNATFERKRVSMNTLMGTSIDAISCEITKVNAPGNFFGGAFLTYRLVG